MSAHPPPVPPANQSTKGPGDNTASTAGKQHPIHPDKVHDNTDEQGDHHGEARERQWEMPLESAVGEHVDEHGNREEQHGEGDAPHRARDRDRDDAGGDRTREDRDPHRLPGHPV